MPNNLPSLGGIGWSSPLVSIEDDWDMGYLTPAHAVERKWHSVITSLDAAATTTDKITISFVSANGAVVPPRFLTDILNPRLQQEAARRQAAAQSGPQPGCRPRRLRRRRHHRGTTAGVLQPLRSIAPMP